MTESSRAGDVAATQAFIELCAARRLSSHTIRAYRRDVETFIEFLDTQTELDLGTADARSVQRYVRYLSDQMCAPGTMRRRLAGLRRFYKWAESEARTSRSPFADLHLQLRRSEDLPRPLRPHDLRILLERCEATRSELDTAARATRRIPRQQFLRYGAVVSLEILFATGVRVAELAALDVTDIDFEDGSIRVCGKGNRQRQVYLVEAEIRRLVGIYATLRARVADGAAALIINSAGRRASPANIRSWIRRLAADCKLESHVTPHRLRHSCATQLLECGVDLRFVQRLLGHRSIATTVLYTGVSDPSLKAALARAVPRARLMQ